MEEKDLTFIQEQIGYKFNNKYLLKQAFTRRSFSEENGGENNEVLEFIGDKVLDFFVIKLLISQNSNSVGLYKKFDAKLRYTWDYETEKKFFPAENTFLCDYSEAKLTEIKKVLVKKKTLANCIDDLGVADYLLMGNGDIQNNIKEEDSVREDLFEAILGAIAIDSNWDMDAMCSAVEIMLNPDSILSENYDENYVALIQEWSHRKEKDIPLYYFEESGCSEIWYSPLNYNCISQRNFDNGFVHKNKFNCFVKLADNLPVFRGFGQSKTEARKKACKVAYEYLCEKGLWFSIRDEIDDPNPRDAISQLEILARRGYFSIPIYEFEQTYDKNGNPIWKSICHIAEKSKLFSAKSSSKKDAKKSAAYKMLQYVLDA